MKVYVASSWRNNQYPLVVAVLRISGHEVYDFRNPHLGPGKGNTGFHWSEIDPQWQEWSPGQFRDALRHPIASDGFASDLAGLHWADACVLVMPCGRSAHLELGYAVGMGKKTCIWLPTDEEPELMYLFADQICVTLEEVLEALGTDSASDDKPTGLPTIGSEEDS